MKEVDIQNVLVVGVDVTALANSANKAGFDVYAVDYFGDQDLKKACKKTLSIVTQKRGRSCGRLETDFSPDALLDLAKQLLTTHQIDAALLASGLEDFPQVVTELSDLVPIAGNNPRTIRKVRDKTRFFHELKRLGVCYPETVLSESLEHGKRAAKDIGYPVLVKPQTSLGGIGVRKAKDRSEFETAFQQIASSSSEAVLVQELVSGMDASVSFLSSKEATVVLTLNEQLLGIREVGQTEPFGYCGNVVPASANKEVKDVCDAVVQNIASHFNLKGSNGIDMVISNDNIPYVVEVNPRFQGTLECVERVLRLNLVDAHMRACSQGHLPVLSERPAAYRFVRLILYTRQRSIAPNLSCFKEVRDIPFPEVIVEEGEPLCSIVAQGETRSIALGKAITLAKHIYGMAKP